MGSVEAMKEGSKDRYFQDVEDDIKKLVPEGIVGRAPYQSPPHLRRHLPTLLHVQPHRLNTVLEVFLL